jgi:hypothetical protein
MRGGKSGGWSSPGLETDKRTGHETLPDISGVTEPPQLFQELKNLQTRLLQRAFRPTNLKWCTAFKDLSILLGNISVVVLYTCESTSSLNTDEGCHWQSAHAGTLR